MQGLEPFTAVVGAARRLAVDGDEVVPIGPQRRHPALEAAPEQERIDPVDQAAQPALAWDAVVERREPPQDAEMVLAPGDDVVEIVALLRDNLNEKGGGVRTLKRRPVAGL